MAPSISLIIPNYNGRAVLPDCLTSVAALDWPRAALEVILVDNASTDGSPAEAARQLPGLRVLAQPRNLGFAPACNQGARAASGEFIAFLNNDARVPPHWLRALAAAFDGAQAGLACAAAPLVSWDGARVDFVGGALTPHGRAFQIDHGLPYDPARYSQPRELLFACGGAMLIRRDVFLSAGGFDDDFVAYFEDVDLGWRLWLLGYRVVLAPEAVTQHRLHATGRRLDTHRRFAISELNALRMMVKNYDDDNLRRLLPVGLLLAGQRAALHGGLDARDYAFPGPLAAPAGGEASEDGTISKAALGRVAALSQLADELPHWLARRAEIQARRVRTDEDIFRRFPLRLGDPMAPWRRHALVEQAALAAAGAPAYLQPAPERHLLIISHETIGPKMAGPGVRCLEMARALAAHTRVTLAAPGRPEADAPGVALVGYDDPAGLEPLINAAGAVLAVGQLVARLPRLRALDRPLIVDWYDPFEIEKLAMAGTVRPEHYRLADQETHLDLHLQARAGDFYLCASERQRDLWLGVLLASGRLNTATAAADPSMRSLLAVVPFGLPAEPPARTRPALKGVVPGIGAEDKVLYWGGGLWQWFDPLTLLDALAQVVAQRPEVKLFFAAGLHFNTQTVPAMPIYTQARERAAGLGLLDRHVFFGDWIPYAERGNYLLEADLGLSLHHAGLESRYAFRTRLLDYIWAGLPMVVTRGDPLAELVEQHGLGQVVPAEDAGAVAGALLALLAQPTLRADLAARFAAMAATLTWDKVVEPVARFLENPRFAPDARRALDELAPAARARQLEESLRAINRGRVMRVLRWIDRLRGLGE
jgi:GT2 family glycosyltransferase/glycosyltransferase involved in cell wall biosynthesis